MEDTTASKPQFDSLLGGQHSLPSAIKVGDFLASRIQEIKALTEVISTPSGVIADMRSFPKHMRRRAMSHNIRRIPKRLRELHANLREKSNTREGPSKVPRRKYRRRPKELLKEYNRRQRKCIWLETHIWHAKRFKMVTKWGYKLPMSPCDKSYRACYRATANHCLIQDISYYNCIEITGSEAAILNGLSNHTNTETGLTFAAQASISGNREGSVIFYRANKYPFGAIGEIKFIWKPNSSVDEKLHRHLWLWCHPGIHDNFLEELINTFKLVKINDEIMECQVISNKEHAENKVELEKVKIRNVPFERTPKYSNQDGITLIDLKDTLNRFRLTGPLSQAVLFQSLKPVCLDKYKVKDEQNWIKRYYFEENLESRSACDGQYKFWSSMHKYYSPSQFAPRCVIPLTIFDPRIMMPTSRSKAIDKSTQEHSSVETKLDIKHLDSPLWLPTIRDKVTQNKLSTEQLNCMRSEKLVPGLETERMDDDNRCHQNLPCLPIILIQRPGSQESSKRLGFGSGWDVISPCGYSMPLWLSFILSGARAGGLREEEAFSRESGISQLCHQPDLDIAKAEDDINRKEKTEEYFRLPPAKRRNYIKLNIPTPFHCPWRILTKDWEGTENFYILRTKKVLQWLRDSLKKGSDSNLLNSPDCPAGALVPVRIDLRGKGIITPNAHICILREGDSKSPPNEPRKNDDNHKTRASLQMDHKKLLKHLARKRHDARSAEREERDDISGKDFRKIIIENSSGKHVVEHAENMRELWLPKCTTIKEVCSRTVIGFISDGDFIFTEGKSCGVGYVIYAGLKELVKNTVLIRSTNTDQYRLANIDVLL